MRVALIVSAVSLFSAVSAIKTLDVAKEETRIRGEKLTTDSDLLKPSNFKNQSQLFHGLTAGQAKYVASNIKAQCPECAKHITSDDIRMIAEANNCRTLREVIRAAPVDAMSEMTFDCLRASRIVYHEVPAKRLVKHLPANIADENEAAFVKLMDKANAFEYLSEEQVKELSKKVCEQLTGPMLPKFKGRLNKMTPDCFRKVQHLDHADINIARMSPLILENVKSQLHDNIHKSINPEQASNMKKTCAFLRVDLMKPSSVSKVSGACFAGFLEKLPDGVHVTIGKNLAKLPEDALALVKEPETLAKLSRSDMQYVRADMMDALLAAHANAAEYLPEGFDIKKAQFTLMTAEPFAAFKPAQQVKLMSTHLEHLSPDFLASVDNEMVAEWRFNGKRGLAVLPVLKITSEQLSHLGTKVPAMGSTPCMVLEDAKQLFALGDDFVASMNRKCFLALSFRAELTEAQLDKIPAAAKLLSNASKATAEELAAAIAAGFCDNVYSYDIKDINRLAWAALTPECVVEIKEFKEFRPEELKAMPDNAFAKFDKVKAAEISELSSLRPEQLAFLTDAGELFTESIAARLSVQQIAKLSAPFMAALPAASYKTFSSADRFAAVAPESLTHVVAEQIKNVPVAVLSKISLAQIAKLGSEVSAPAEDPLAVFQGEAFKSMIGEDVKQAIEVAKSSRKPAAVSSAVSGMVSASFIALVAAVVLSL